MWDKCEICGAIWDPSVADHYEWHAGVDPVPDAEPAPAPEINGGGA